MPQDQDLSGGHYDIVPRVVVALPMSTPQFELYSCVQGSTLQLKVACVAQTQNVPPPLGSPRPAR